MIDEVPPKRLFWVGSSRKDFVGFPDEVKAEMGYALFVAQCGGRHRRAKTLKGAGDAGVVEIVDSWRGDAFRTVYAIRFASGVYVLHAFQKKSKAGAATPTADICLIEARLREARQLHDEASDGQTH